MWEFPSDVAFQSKWRPYQARVLKELEGLMDDERLHVVAAPASGKTVLGIEVARRLNGPTLILAPTLAIRDQWVQRLEELFLPPGSTTPNWVSYDLSSPSFFTVSTYQMLHSIMHQTPPTVSTKARQEPETDIEQQQPTDSDVEDEEEQQLEEEELDERLAYLWLNQRRFDNRNAPTSNLVSLLNQIGIKTVILDEAHHLRSSWWKSLTDLIDGLENIHILALTATPPYDVSPAEWDRYIELCGPVDTEISVPELVREKNLCPHQDLVIFSTPVDAEASQIGKFRDDVVELYSDLKTNQAFVNLIASYPWLINPHQYLDDILHESDVYISMLVFLNHVGASVSPHALSLIASDLNEVPEFNYDWLEILLTGIFFSHTDTRPVYDNSIESILKQLRNMGAVQRRKVVLQNPDFIGKLLKRSVSKMDSIVDIANVEYGASGDKLRMVILADHIRKAYLPSQRNPLPVLDKMGVIPIFERLRRANIVGAKLAVLTGSIIIIPSESEKSFRNEASGLGMTGNDFELSPLLGDDQYQLVKVLSPDRHKIVRIMTSLFSQGGIHILVGTKSLLGEGWDAPSINSLVISSVVGSFMLSNQMRGRAIRIEPGNPLKTANIWHLVCVEPNVANAGEDYDTIVRRFRAFVGVSQAEPLIENGFGRLMTGPPPFSKEEIWEINERMFTRAMQRDEIRERWERALGDDANLRLIEDAKFHTTQIPRALVLGNPIVILLTEILLIAGMITTYNFGWGIWMIIALNLLMSLSVVFAIPAISSLVQIIRHFNPRHSLGSTASAVLRSLCEAGHIQTPYHAIQIVTSQGIDGSVYCHIRGANRREESIFLQALQETLNPIDDPRYILKRTPLRQAMPVYFSVPKLLGLNREFATLFQRNWRRYVIKMELIFTRNSKGRLELLKAKAHSKRLWKDMRAQTVTSWK